jgi:anti-sigma factor RsiW
MSDHPRPFAGARQRPGEDAAREADHRRLIELLGAHADGELPPETAAQLDAHLVGCARCRRELEVHVAVRQRLAAEPLAPASPELLERITGAVRGLPTPAPVAAGEGHASPLAGRWVHAHRWLAATLLLLVLAATASASRLWSDWRQPAAGTSGRALAASTAPLLGAVLEDYRRVVAGDLPGRARDLAAVRAAVPFELEPLRGRQLRLLGAWTTSLAGEPAAVLAYRWDDRLVLHYVVSEHLFFRHPAIRAAVAGGRLLTAADGAQSLVGWPEATAGSLLVGDASLRQLAGVRADAGPR